MHYQAGTSNFSRSLVLVSKTRRCGQDHLQAASIPQPERTRACTCPTCLACERAAGREPRRSPIAARIPSNVSIGRPPGWRSSSHDRRPDQHGLGECFVHGRITGHFATSQSGRHESRPARPAPRTRAARSSLRVHRCRSSWLDRPPCAAAWAIQRFPRGEHHLVVPGVRAQRPSVAEDNRLSATPSPGSADLRVVLRGIVVNDGLLAGRCAQASLSCLPDAVGKFRDEPNRTSNLEPCRGGGTINQIVARQCCSPAGVWRTVRRQISPTRSGTDTASLAMAGCSGSSFQSLSIFIAQMIRSFGASRDPDNRPHPLVSSPCVEPSWNQPPPVASGIVVVTVHHVIPRTQFSPFARDLPPFPDRDLDRGLEAPSDCPWRYRCSIGASRGVCGPVGEVSVRPQQS